MAKKKKSTRKVTRKVTRRVAHRTPKFKSGKSVTFDLLPTGTEFIGFATGNRLKKLGTDCKARILQLGRRNVRGYVGKVVRMKHDRLVVVA